MTELDYASYLQTDVLLSLQDTKIPDTAARAAVLSEHFFIIAHQSCELWLKQLIADLSEVRDVLSAPFLGGFDGLELCIELLGRSADLLRLLYEQVIALERLPLRHFVAFRPHLGTASGAQSGQFRVLGRLIGDAKRDGELYRAFALAAERLGCPVADVCRRGIESGALHRIAEGLLDVGNGLYRWKVAHLGLMSKMVGGQQGTAGTSGEDFLVNRISLPFAELRSLRGLMHIEADLAQAALVQDAA